MQVPLVDLAAQFSSLRGEILQVIDEVLTSGQLFLGPHTRAFEAEFAAYCGSRYAIGVANGTDALHLALKAAGIGPGDEVITVSHTFIATVEAIVQTGAQPVLVDIDSRTYTMAVDQAAAKITPRTRALLPVHLYGRLADLDGLGELARQHRLLLIEDASQAHGAADLRGRRAGSIGDIGCFSFYYAKNLGAYGEAGAITTSRADLDERIRLLRSHGEGVRYEHAVMGYNSRPDEIQCAVLRLKLRELDRWNGLRRQHAARYDALLADLPVQRPERIEDARHVYHQYVVRVAHRDAVRSAMAEAGIGTGVHYPIPVHLQAATAFLDYHAGDLPLTEHAAREVVSLPMYPELSPAQLDHVGQALRRATSRSAVPS